MSDNTSAVRTAEGGYAVPVVQPEHVQRERTGHHVRDRRTEIGEYVHREILRLAQGESFRYDVVPVCAPSGEGIEVGYVLYVSTALPVPIGARVAVGSKPFEFDAGEDFVQQIVNAVLKSLRYAVRTALAADAEGLDIRAAVGMETIPRIGDARR